MTARPSRVRRARHVRSWTVAVAAVVLLPGLLAACSGSPRPDATTSSTGQAAKGVSLAECMRDKGYEMPDPKSGGNTMELSAPDGIDQEQYKADLATCLDSTTGDADGAGEAGVAEEAPGGNEQQKKVAECIREHGFADYPDGQDARATYEPDDENAFEDVSKRCSEKAFGAGSTADEQ